MTCTRRPPTSPAASEGRPNDWIGFGVGQTLPNLRSVHAVAMGNLVSGTTRRMPTQERFLEAFYRIDVADDIVVRPNIQYITRRGSPEIKPDVVVFGVRSLITFSIYVPVPAMTQTVLRANDASPAGFVVRRALRTRDEPVGTARAVCRRGRSLPGLDRREPLEGARRPARTAPVPGRNHASPDPDRRSRVDRHDHCNEHCRHRRDRHAALRAEVSGRGCRDRAGAEAGPAGHGPVHRLAR
ncbi:carbohydrate porin [Methylobacterium sp. J-030]|uniref:carbohydrate porin n=1 Tax=Methylobacterium sp. J-030 TaxID=2836627 RepID=UPI00391A70D7